jgi:hypothetical protein
MVRPPLHYLIPVAVVVVRAVFVVVVVVSSLCFVITAAVLLFLLLLCICLVEIDAAARDTRNAGISGLSHGRH